MKSHSWAFYYRHTKYLKLFSFMIIITIITAFFFLRVRIFEGISFNRTDKEDHQKFENDSKILDVNRELRLYIGENKNQNGKVRAIEEKKKKTKHNPA